VVDHDVTGASTDPAAHDGREVGRAAHPVGGGEHGTGAGIRTDRVRVRRRARDVPCGAGRR
jgi:hypothetical protein